MFRVTVRHRTNRAMIGLVERRVKDRAGRRVAHHAAALVRGNIVAKGRVGTGRMMGAVQADRTPLGWCVVVKAGQAQIYKWQDQGTADHGPVKAQALRFTAGGGVVFAAKVRGVEPGNFTRDAVRALRNNT